MRVSRWMLPGEAARLLGMSRSGAQWLADTGRIRAVRTASGVRLLAARDVERLRQEREKSRAVSPVDRGHER